MADNPLGFSDEQILAAADEIMNPPANSFSPGGHHPTLGGRKFTIEDETAILECASALRAKSKAGKKE